jgi:hypothetical protein
MADKTAPSTEVADDDGIELEDTEINFETEADLDDGSDDLDESKIDDSMDEDDTEAVSEEEAKAEPEENETEEEAEDKPEAEAEVELSEAEKQKAFNDEMAKKRIQERENRKAQEELQKTQQQAYVAEADGDPVQEAVRQLQVDAYNNKVESNTNKLQNGYERAVKDFPILNDQTPEIQAEVNAAIDAFQAMHVKIDQWGNPSEVSGDLYTYLQSKADSIQRLTAIGARNQVENKVKEKSKTFTPPSKTPKEPKIDPDLEAFDEEANRW